MYEKRQQPLISRTAFTKRVIVHIGTVMPLIIGSLVIGMIGYKFLEDMGWVDALFNASMIMSGMGPATELHTWEGKVFASVYAIYSGLFLIAVTGFLMVPFLHRIMHKFHRDNEL